MRYVVMSYRANMMFDEERDAWVTGMEVPDNAFVTVQDFNPGYSTDDPGGGTISVNIIFPFEETDGEVVQET